MSKEKILAAYEHMAKAYSDAIEHKAHNAYYDRPAVLSLIENVEGKKVLDAACGPGKYAEILISQGADLIGLDISPNMIAEAKQRNGANGRFLVHDLAHPMDMLADQSIDLIVCALAMHYIEDWTLTVQEYHRVLKNEAYIVLSIEHPFQEYLYHKTGQYFGVESVSAYWGSFGVEVPAYRRSLQQCLLPFTEHGFVLEKLIEPKPVAEFEERDPKYWKILNQFPAFMCMKLKKKHTFR